MPLPSVGRSVLSISLFVLKIGCGFCVARKTQALGMVNLLPLARQKSPRRHELYYRIDLPSCCFNATYDVVAKFPGFETKMTTNAFVSPSLCKL